MASLLSNLVNNPSEGIHQIKCKYRHHDKKCETCGITYEVCDCFPEYKNLKDHLIEYECNKKLSTKVWWKFIETIFDTYKFSHYENNKFILLLWKGVYPYEYMIDWDKFNETSSPKNGVFIVI